MLCTEDRGHCAKPRPGSSDKAFIAGLGEDVEDTAIVWMIIELAHTLGMKVIAEGWSARDRHSSLRRWAATRGRATTLQYHSLPKLHWSF